MAWPTIADIRELAPDAKSLASGRTLARPGAWSDLGATDVLLWGRCQGSGAQPYQVTIDATGPDVTCTCPSRKQPCKHGLALLLLQASGGVASAGSPPDGTQVRARQKADRAATPAPKVADPQARARRLERRLQLMDGGLAELERWLEDVMGAGLASVRTRPYAWWDGVAGRLVDAQVPGLADRVRGMPGRLAGNDGWASLLLAELARWWLAARSWRRRDQLDPADHGDLRTYLGWSRTAEEVLAGQRVDGTWTVMGVGTSQLGRLTEQRTWLWHDTHGHAQVLDFAQGGVGLAVPQLVGAQITAEVAVYPGRSPQRVRFVEDPVPEGQVGELPDVGQGWGSALEGVAGLAAAAPFQDRFPVAVAGVRLLDIDGSPTLVDDAGAQIPAVGIDRWGMLALTGGRPVTVFGELLEDGFRALSVAGADGLLPVPAPEAVREPWSW